MRVKNFVAGIIVGTILAGGMTAVARVTMVQIITCTPTSNFACIAMPGTSTGVAVIRTKADAGNPTLDLPTQSGTLATEEKVSAMIAAALGAPSPTPSPTPTATPTPSATPTPTPGGSFSITASVRFYDGSLDANTSVDLLNANMTLRSRLQSPGNGFVIFNNVPAGNYVVRVSTNYASSPTQYNVTLGQNANLPSFFIGPASWFCTPSDTQHYPCGPKAFP
jgi:hypothetical protein